MASEADFSLLLAEFDDAPNVTEEDELNFFARFIFTFGWTVEDEQPCGNCGLPCRYRKQGVAVHPVCPDMPPDLTWEEVRDPAGRLKELLEAMKIGLRIVPHDRCARCGRPTRFQDQDGVHFHPRCVHAQRATTGED